MTRLREDLLREFQDFAQTAPAAKSLMERISEIRRFSATSTPPLRNLTTRLPKNILACMADFSTSPRRKSITAQNLEEARTAAYENDPQTELVILGSSENPAVTTCGWAKRFFENVPTGF
jgi:hypothetical protein